MSLGGWLVVMDRAGRDVKHYRLRSGSATLGSDRACDIRVMVPTVSPHHATVSVLYHQTVVRSVSERETLVNGAPVSVAALRHGDVISLGGRALRWEYRVPGVRGPLAPEPALLRRVQRARAPRRGSEPPPRNVIVPEHRASMPASTSGKQVAIVQPQRRDTSDMSDAASTRFPPNKRPRMSRNTLGAEPAVADGDKTKRKSGVSPRTVPSLSDTTKATLWIESRKTSPRKSAAKIQATARTPVRAAAPRKSTRKAFSAKKTTPLRMVVLKKAQSAQKINVTKIQAPLKMDSTKQAAIMLMTRHTPKSKQTSPNRGNKGPSFVVKKPSPVRETPKNKKSSGIHTSAGPSLSPVGGRGPNRHQSDNTCLSIIEITDSETQPSTRESSATRRSGNSSLRSPHLISPKKSALKDPNAKRSNRKTESIKFDLSNLDNSAHNRSSDVMVVSDVGNNSYTDDSESEFTLRYSDASKSPSPRKSINSRSRRILENTLGTSVMLSPKSDRRTLTAESPQTRKALRGSIIVQEALRINKSDGTEISTYSRRTTKSLSDHSWSTTVASSTRQTRTVSPRASRSNLESYSIVDLVSMDSNDSGSVYTSADSNRSVTYDTPGSQNLQSVGRRAIGCSTPYDLKKKTPDYELREGSPGIRKQKARLPRRSGATGDADTSVTTPENTEDTTNNITLNSTKISRTSKKRFRIITRQNALIFMDDEVSEDDSSPKSSKRTSKGGQGSPLIPKNISVSETFANSPCVNEGHHTPENRHSPVEASTPVLNIQSLLEASRNCNTSPKSGRGGLSKRKTIAVLRSEPRKGRTGMKSKSLNVRRSGRGRGISAKFDGSDDSTLTAEEEVVTPKSAAKPLPEGVKNKHSSAKKTQSKRSLIDNLNESDIVKQLFNSPVKRKLSQSMTEFSRRHLFDDDEDRPRRPARATTAVAGRSRDRSLTDQTEPFTPEIFVSPLSTPSNSPNMTGIKRLFQKSTPDNDLRHLRGVRRLLRTPRTRKSIKNDLSNVSGVKAVFAKSPRNRLSDVRVKEIFATSPRNDLRQVSGVKHLFKSQRKKHRSPRNELDDLRGVRTLFKEHGLESNSPRNDLTDVRGVKRLFRQERQRNELSDVSGVEQLFHESADCDSTFDQLLGRPPIRAVYKSKSFTTTGKVQKREKNKKSKSLLDVNLITSNVEEWLQKELTERLHKNAPADTSSSKGRKSLNKSRSVSKTMRELQKLNTDTVNGSVPVMTNRTRNSSILNIASSDVSSQKKSASELYGAHTLPIKKRSLVEAAANTMSNDRSHKLPIKKRAVIHSTPVKGRVNITMNASEIGRMSPICSDDRAAQIDNMPRSPQSQVSSRTKSPPVKTNPTVATPPKQKLVEVVRVSPKKTRSAKVARSSPAPPRTRRGRKAKPEGQELLNVKRRRSSIVITKKIPVLSPQRPSPKVTRKGKIRPQDIQDPPKISPKKTRSTRGRKSQASVDINLGILKKNTSHKVTRTTVSVTKPSPKIKPRATRHARDQSAQSQTKQDQLRTKRTRKITITTPEGEDNKKTKQFSKESHVEVQSNRKSRKNTADSQLGAPRGDISLPTIQTRRSRKTVVETAQSEIAKERSNAQGRRTRKVTEDKTDEEANSVAVPASAEHATRRGRRAKVNDTAPAQGRGRKEAAKPAATSVAESRTDSEAVDIQPKRGRRTKQVPPEDNKNAANELPTGRGRKRKNTERDEHKTEDNAEKKETRSTKKAQNEIRNTKSSGRVRNTRRGAGDATDDTTQKSSVEAVAALAGVKSVKRRKAPSPPVERVPPAVGGSKRTNVEISDAKENKREPTKKPRKAAAPSPPVRATRARSNIATAGASRAGGRAPRR